MKVFICVALLCLAYNAFAARFDYKNATKAGVIREECKDGLTEEEISKIDILQFANPTQGMKCFARCVLTKAGAFENGAIIENGIRNIFRDDQKDDVQRVIDKCINNTGDDPCDVAYKFLVCFDEA